MSWQLLAGLASPIILFGLSLLLTVLIRFGVALASGRTKSSQPIGSSLPSFLAGFGRLPERTPLERYGYPLPSSGEIPSAEELASWRGLRLSREDYDDLFYRRKTLADLGYVVSEQRSNLLWELGRASSNSIDQAFLGQGDSSRSYGNLHNPATLDRVNQEREQLGLRPISAGAADCGYIVPSEIAREIVSIARSQGAPLPSQDRETSYTDEISRLSHPLDLQAIEPGQLVQRTPPSPASPPEEYRPLPSGQVRRIR